MNGEFDILESDEFDDMEFENFEEFDDFELETTRKRGPRIEYTCQRIAELGEPTLRFPGFEFNRTYLIDSHVYNLINFLKEIVRLARHKSIEIVIVGHTDSIGSARYNYSLGLKRAKVMGSRLRAWLAEKLKRAEFLGTRFGNISLVEKSCGESRPWKSNRTKAGRAANRRVEIFFVPR